MAAMTTATVRARMGRRAESVRKIVADLTTAIEDKALSAVDIRWINDVSGCIMTERERFDTLAEVVLDEEEDEGVRETDARVITEFKGYVQEALRLAAMCHSMKSLDVSTQLLRTNIKRLRNQVRDEPEKNHGPSLKLCSQLQDALVATMQAASVEETHPQRIAADSATNEYLELAASIVQHVPPAEGKPRLSSETGLGGMKYALHAAPTFSGDQKDFQSFWAEFRQIHETPQFSEAAKLAYLRQGQQDPDIKRRIAENIENGDNYKDVIDKFRRQFDRPRQMHKIQVRNLVQLGPVKPHRSSILDCVNTINSALNGLKRLEQYDVDSMITSIVEDLLPSQLKARWSDVTLGEKKVPPISKLIAFLEERADQPQYMDKPHSTPQWKADPKGPSKPKGSPRKGAINASQSQPIPSQPQQVEPQINRGTSNERVQTRGGQGGSYQIKYTCPECAELHYAFSCARFREKTVSQRKAYVSTHSLCYKCLKPGHGVGECRNKTNCRICEGRHNVLLHPSEGVSPTTSVVGSVNTLHSQGTGHSFTKRKLLQTCEVEAMGPTGKRLTLRAFIDEGADSSSITTRASKMLQLKALKQVVEVTAFGDVGTQQCKVANLTISSRKRQDWSLPVSAIIVDKIMGLQPRLGAEKIRELVEEQGLDPADPKFDQPGRVDLLLGADVIPFIQSPEGANHSVIAKNTVFGHVFLGSYDSVPDTIPIVGSIQVMSTGVVADKEKDELSQAVTRFWEAEQPLARQQVMTADEKRVQQHFYDTHKFLPLAGRYEVTLPRLVDRGTLGDSRNMALQRFCNNERALLRKGNWGEFQKVVAEYLELAHARPCTPVEADMTPSGEVYYMPMHGVSKTTSTTTKLRVVFDASAKTTSGLSFNDTLATGPMLHMTLDKILLRFRKHRVALTGDIRKMYREIVLTPGDQQYHRFVWRAQVSDPVQEYCMNRVTFGVKSSPYVAVQTLQQAAVDFGEGYPEAVEHINRSFYVDDLLAGADTVADTIKLQGELSSILSNAGFELRKYRSSKPEVLNEIPDEFVETMPKMEWVDNHTSSYPKALGIGWNSQNDTVSVAINTMVDYECTKRGVLGDISKTFDVLGWICPVILPMKLLMQQLWNPNLGWDAPLSDELMTQHKSWREELGLLKDWELPRCYFAPEPTQSVMLHGFSDASEKAYGAAVYIRATYEHHPPSVQLVVAKSRVLPLKQKRTIPEAELCGAVLLSDLLYTVQQTLELDSKQVRAWSDSTIVLCWLRSQPTKYKIFVGNRITSATEHYPSTIWGHVPTDENPADHASRGTTAAELMGSQLWWKGPSWLASEPMIIPRQPQKDELNEEAVVGMRASCLPIGVAAPPPYVWVADRFRSYDKLVRVIAWVRRAASNFGAIGLVKKKKKRLSVDEVESAEIFMLRRSQERSFSSELRALSQSPPQHIPRSSNILSLHPIFGQDGLLHIGGRLSHADIMYIQQHPIILSAKDALTRRIFEQYHINSCHCGPTLLMSSVGQKFYCTGARLLARQICKQCLLCRKVQSKALPQLMGQLPKPRVTPARPFATTGVDYCGPFNFREGRGRRLITLEGYLAIFVCFVTKSVHIEPVTDQTTGTFLAALKRFVARRNLPRHIHSDNGSNFVGASNELEKLHQLLGTDSLPDELQTYLVDHRIVWHTIPSRAPHFGGLWEAAVKSTKYHLKRVVG